MRLTASQAVYAASAVLAAASLKGEPPPTPSEPSNGPAVPFEHTEPGAVPWEFGASAYLYFVPEARNYAQPTVTADRGGLHLEARYNYEALETGSAWIGCNLAGGEGLTWELTPMLGGVVGKSMGVAPGVSATLGWWRLELSAEGEYMMDVGDREGSFLYVWSELTLTPVEGFRLGVAVQRTRAYQSELDIQRGVVAGFTYKALDLSAYVFDPDKAEPTVVVAVGVSL